MDYIELEVWKQCRILVNSVYEATKQFPTVEVHGLTSQWRRCAVSMPSNIAEGCGRRTSKETIQFLHVSRGSNYEMETQLYLALDQKYLVQTDFDSSKNQIIKCKKLINGFINYYKSSNR